MIRVYLDEKDKYLSRYSLHNMFGVATNIIVNLQRKQGNRVSELSELWNKQWILHAMCRWRDPESVLCKHFNVRNTHILRWLILRERRRIRLWRMILSQEALLWLPLGTNHDIAPLLNVTACNVNKVTGLDSNCLQI